MRVTALPFYHLALWPLIPTAKGITAQRAFLRHRHLEQFAQILTLTLVHAHSHSHDSSAGNGAATSSIGTSTEAITHVPDHRRRNVIDLREAAQPLVGLQPHHQRQQVPVILGRPGPRPLDLVIGRGERLSQLPPRHRPGKPADTRSDRPTSHQTPADAANTTTTTLSERP